MEMVAFSKIRALAKSVMDFERHLITAALSEHDREQVGVFLTSPNS
jgi:hypothetical protein